MICPICKGNMEEDSVNFPVDLKTRFVLIKGVPALVCEQCGEFFIDDKIHIQIEHIIKKVKELNVELEVVKFAA
jgi:YgiT-type zinc finger domain-containing protein